MGFAAKLAECFYFIFLLYFFGQILGCLLVLFIRLFFIPV